MLRGQSHGRNSRENLKFPLCLKPSTAARDLEEGARLPRRSWQGDSNGSSSSQKLGGMCVSNLPVLGHSGTYNLFSMSVILNVI